MNAPSPISLVPTKDAFARALLGVIVFFVALTAKDAPSRASDSATPQASVLKAMGNPGVQDELAPCPTTPPTDQGQCGGGPCVVDIKESAKASNNSAPFELLKSALERPNTTVRIGPNVELDFDGWPAKKFPLVFGRCTTLMSVGGFEPAGAGASRVAPQQKSARRADIGPVGDLEVELPPRTGSARTPKSVGPVLKFGTKHPTDLGEDAPQTFLEMKCQDGFNADGARVSGFQLYGKSFGPQKTSEVGVRIVNCVNVEVSNMEIAAWGEAAIKVQDNDPELLIPEGCVKLPPTGHPRPLSKAYSCPEGKVVTRVIPGPGGRISRADQVRIFDNFLHHNQHPSEGGHAAGYGVNVGYGAWAKIYRNVFDFNRHAIAASGDSGGYVASHNLVLKGGGIHGGRFNYYTHQFDYHGDKNCGFGSFFSNSLWNCGHSGHEVVYEANAFQYIKDNAIKVRGKPRIKGFIDNNVFAHDHDDVLDGAIALRTQNNIEIGPGNVPGFDPFGSYGVCDFDADGVDDLFLATGATWWYSSFGEFHWSYLNAKKQTLNQIRLGYFDNDLRCDVLTEIDGRWWYSSGGYGGWQLLGEDGEFNARLTEVEFGRFDRNQPDFRPGATRQTTHAFRRDSEGQWSVTPLSSRNWTDVASSGFSMNKLKFGDFTGDGVTDVLAVVSGRWKISDAALGEWDELNPVLGDDVSSLKIANMDPDDNIDDILRLERRTRTYSFQNRLYERTELIWWRSKNGRGIWRKFKEYSFYFPVSKESVLPRFGFVGRFGLAPGGGTLVINQERFGWFYSEAETRAGRHHDFRSVFAY